MKDDCGIYLILNKINGKGYIGLSSQISERKKQHLRMLKANNHYNTHLQNAFNKYGRGNFEFLILEYCSKEQLPTAEKSWIGFLNTYEKGYNLTLGGEDNCGFYPNKKTRKIMSIKAKRRMTKEYRQYLSQINTKKKHSRETKAKISKKIKGRKQSKQEKYNKSKSTSQTGIFRLSIKNPDDNHHYIRFRYTYYKNGKRKSILRKNIKDVYNFVCQNELEWIILDEQKALIYLNQIK